MGAGERSAANEARRDRVAVDQREGAALLAVLRVVPQRRHRRAGRRDEGGEAHGAASLRLVEDARLAAGQAPQRGSGVPHRAAALPRGRGARPQRRAQAQDGPQARRQRLLALRPIAAAGPSPHSPMPFVRLEMN